MYASADISIKTATAQEFFTFSSLVTDASSSTPSSQTKRTASSAHEVGKFLLNYSICYVDTKALRIIYKNNSTSEITVHIFTERFSPRFYENTSLAT